MTRPIGRTASARTASAARPQCSAGRTARRSSRATSSGPSGRRAGRRLDRHGYARFRHWRLYGEHGLRGEPVAVWRYGEHLTLEDKDETLSHFTVHYGPDGKGLRTVEAPQVCETAYRSPQLGLWEVGDDQWRTALPVAPAGHRPRRRADAATQARLFA